jgi:Protein of unknown function (DUF1573)
MKKILFTLFAIGTAFFAIAQQAATTTPAIEPLQLSETSFNFGKIAQGKPVTHNFIIYNTGKEPLKLENVQASCGCTTPEWSREPIEPGKSSTIKVGYNSAAEGIFDKAITVYYNGGQVKQLSIKGTVWKTPDQSAPINEALSIFKQ